MEISEEDLNKKISDAKEEGKKEGKKDLDSLQNKYDTLDDEYKSYKDGEADRRAEAMKKGESRAQMSAEEKAKADLKDKQDALDEAKRQNEDREAELNRRESVSNIKGQLSDKGLDTDFADLLYDEDEDKCNEKVNNFIEKWNTSVQDATNTKLKGGNNPQNGKGGTGESDSDVSFDDYKKKTLGEKMKFANEYPEQYEKFEQLKKEGK
ncbi:DUF4355 domain-containing protein (plasmid) [Apilactobacillus apisilvae]|uniref:DUF4355 domain-containing protein n=1 Tax=Apilactobacillus apisilvae TaxID=2923364 RepID=A0ABY4PK52_9LACO|nr:DUF4355 domain-containing protein [Apilactobacillus apisilvae]UQS85776.1 DUF4355 domain-containing protein [Apilactobacillus apisilvae]